MLGWRWTARYHGTRFLGLCFYLVFLVSGPRSVAKAEGRGRCKFYDVRLFQLEICEVVEGSKTVKLRSGHFGISKHGAC